MAFAITLFLEAATRRVLPAPPPVDVLLEDPCALLYETLCADVGSSMIAVAVPDTLAPDTLAVPVAVAAQEVEQASLYVAFRVLWSHYERDPLQAAICARILALYFLMEHTAGMALAEWVQPIPETPQFVTLHPAVIQAIGTVRLNGSVLLCQTAFPELVAGIAAGWEQA